MRRWVESVYDIESNIKVLRARPYGMIEVAGGKLVRIQLKPWPKIASVVEARWVSGWKNRRRPHDICRLYYNQPLHHRNYLTLAYVESTPQTRWRSVLKSMRLLDQIASLKTSNAILTELSNSEISDRLMERLGYQEHLLDDPRRHWIKRFYGKYPSHTTSGLALIESPVVERFDDAPSPSPSGRSGNQRPHPVADATDRDLSTLGANSR